MDKRISKSYKRSGLNTLGGEKMLSPVFDNFIDQSPISVIARASMERVMNPEQLDDWFKRTAEHQYEKNLLFSSVFGLMGEVVCGIRPSVHAAYQAAGDQISVAGTSVYNKLNGIETNTSRELVRYTAGQVVPIIEKLGGTQTPPLPGYNVKLLDGNCIEASEHRIEELRHLAAGALPGKSLVVFDPVTRIPIDVFPCEDGHAQERSLLGAVLQTVQKKDVIIADRNFCVVSFTTGIHDAKGFFIIREHGNYPWKSLGKEKAAGRVENGRVYEQPIQVTDENGKEYRFRCIPRMS